VRLGWGENEKRVVNKVVEIDNDSWDLNSISHQKLLQTLKVTSLMLPKVWGI